MVNIMKNIYSLEPAFLLDNKKCKYSANIYDVSFLKSIDCKDYLLFLTSTNPIVYKELKEAVSSYFPIDRILEFPDVIPRENPKSELHTDIGRYCYGPLCRNHELIESIGNFCSFAPGVDVVPNHEMRFVTTHPILFACRMHTGIEIDYEYFKDEPWYMPGIEPKSIVEKRKRITIGNDVWLGRNVIITNSANIGNGVIAGAGAVITKDVPDYSIVAGVPARIVRYRYTQEQIEALNGIAWWNWSDEEIRKRYDDFYLPIDAFIEKYK